MPTPAALHVQPVEPNWRESASLIILAQHEDDDNRNRNFENFDFDYSLLMVKRSGGSSFMASAFVFPGGVIEQFDFDSKWYQLYAKHGIASADLHRSISNEIVGPRPPIIRDPIKLRAIHSSSSSSENNSDSSQPLHPDIALRITAIRETFEESGILLLTSPATGLQQREKQPQSSPQYSSAIALTAAELAEWQLRVRKSAEAFYELCDQLRLVPNIWSLYEWSDWLTPVNIGHRRFDTIFYVCCLRTKPTVRVDNAEVTKMIWCNPISILQEHHQEAVFLPPPQVYELSRMLHFNSLERFDRFVRARQVLGTERWLPIILTYDDGSISVLPGDDRYPLEPQLIATEPVAEFTGSIDDANRESSFKNRIDLRGIQSKALCTIEPGCGHLPPLTFDENFQPPPPPSSSSDRWLQSKL